jgi:hypothetical protein
MSTKLNAEQLLANRFSEPYSSYGSGRIDGYVDAIREVAQPIADERDELRQALEKVMAYREGVKPFDFHSIKSQRKRHIATFDAWIKIEYEIRAILAKYPKP